MQRISIGEALDDVAECMTQICRRNREMIDYYIYPNPTPSLIDSYEPVLKALEIRIKNLKKLSFTQLRQLIDSSDDLAARYLLQIIDELQNAIFGFTSLFIEHYDLSLAHRIPYETIYERLQDINGRLGILINDDHREHNRHRAEHQPSTTTARFCRGAIQLINGSNRGSLNIVETQELLPANMLALRFYGGFFLWWSCRSCAFRLRYHVVGGEHSSIENNDEVLEHSGILMEYRSSFLAKSHMFYLHYDDELPIGTPKYGCLFCFAEGKVLKRGSTAFATDEELAMHICRSHKSTLPPLLMLNVMKVAIDGMLPEGCKRFDVHLHTKSVPPATQEPHEDSSPIYQKLGAGKIRLVVLQCGERDAPIDVQLRILPFDDKIMYDALSYSVGAHGGSALINLECDGHREELRVSARLESILRHLRVDNEDQILWVDALSINQHDSEERAREVRRLGQIFAAARRVCIWLGKAADDSDLAIDYIPEILDFSAIDRLVGDETKKLHWLALARLMAREWFTRRWVVQEMAHARNPIVFCGDRRIPWSDLAKAAALLKKNWHKIVTLLPPIEAFMLGDAQMPGATNLIELSTNIFRRDGSTQRLEPKLGIEDLLDLLPMFDVTIPLDSVYSLIDIASDTYATDNIKVDYNLRPPELFGDVMKLIVEGSKSLDIICRPWAPDCDLPSWITTRVNYAFERRDDGQYFRRNADSLVGSPRKRIYHASDNVEAECQFVGLDPMTNKCIIKCSGLLLGRVKATGGRAINGNIPQEWRELADWADRRQPVPEAFWRTMVADRDPGGNKPPNWYEKTCEDSFRKGGTDIDVSHLISVSSTLEKEFLRRVQAIVWSRVFFTMNIIGKYGDQIYFGLGPAKVAAGDEVVILYGCSVPVILRKWQELRDDHTYKLVGEAFVYDFMDGEAIKELRKSCLHLSEFSIA